VSGDKWLNEELGLSYETLKPAHLKVPAGEFAAVRVKVEGGFLGGSETRYYAKGIGLVKTEFDDGSHPIVLTSFRASKNGKPK
jgi:hypothetical protein